MAVGRDLGSLRNGGVFLFVLATVSAIAILSKNFDRQGLRASQHVFEKRSLAFEKIKDSPDSSVCSSAVVSEDYRSKLYYHDCRSEHFDSWKASFAPEAPFEIPNGLEHRVFFWRGIYTQFAQNHYVLHSGYYPEVIFESIISKNSETTLKHSYLKNTLKKNRRVYMQVLRTMHTNRNNEAFKYTSLMQRLAKQMEHIADPNKYQLAASSIRIQRGQKTQIADGIVRAKKYMGTIYNIFDDKQLPKELAHIAFVESSFNPKAYSKVGAAGAYQIMPFVARKHMLMSDLIDERKDPIKSAKVAAELFRSNYDMLQSWPLAVTGYNHGPYGVRRAVTRSGSTDLVRIIETYKSNSFGFASKNFYAEYLAILSSLKELDVEFSDDVNFIQFKLVKKTRGPNLAKQFKLGADEFLAMNPDIDRRKFWSRKLPKGFVVKVKK